MWLIVLACALFNTAPAQSISSCEDLGWTNTDTYGNPSVCGSSDNAPLEACGDELTWIEATAFCENVGARLCTRGELQNDEARGTGCSGDRNLVWSSTPCDVEGSYYQTYGSSRQNGEYCAVHTETTKARCCSDVRMPSTQPTVSNLILASAESISSCDDLGWTNTDTYGSPYVCGSSDDDPLEACSGELRWAEALAFCENVGARLCTRGEL